MGRAGLRQLLLSGLEDVVAFDKAVVGSGRSSDGQVVVHLADGTSARGDVLVGADGSASAVRKQLLPEARVLDTGVAGIAGKVYLTEQARQRVGPRLLSQMTMVLPLGGMGMFLAPFERRADQPESADALDLPEHLFWVLLSRATLLGLAPGSRPQSARQLQDLALQKADRWHPLLRWLVEEADPASVVGVPLYTSRPVAPWRTTNVTLLGDAIHTMDATPGTRRQHRAARRGRCCVINWSKRTARAPRTGGRCCTGLSSAGRRWLSGQQLNAHADSVWQRLHDAADLFDSDVREGLQTQRAANVRRQRHRLDVGEVDAQANAWSAAEGGQRVRVPFVLFPRRQKAIRIEPVRLREHGRQPVARGDSQKHGCPGGHGVTIEVKRRNDASRQQLYRRLQSPRLADGAGQ